MFKRLSLCRPLELISQSSRVKRRREKKSGKKLKIFCLLSCLALIERRMARKKNSTAAFLLCIVLPSRSSREASQRRTGVNEKNTEEVPSLFNLREKRSAPKTCPSSHSRAPRSVRAFCSRCRIGSASVESGVRDCCSAASHSHVHESSEPASVARRRSNRVHFVMDVQTLSEKRDELSGDRKSTRLNPVT